MNVNKAVLYLGCFGIGIIAGLRSLTAPAMVSWAVHLGWLDLSGSRLSFFGSMAATIILTILALCELVADKLPRTPNRTDAGRLIFRIITGGFSAIVVCASARQPLAIGVILGRLGAIAGAFAGCHHRHCGWSLDRLPYSCGSGDAQRPRCDACLKETFSSECRPTGNLTLGRSVAFSSRKVDSPNAPSNDSLDSCAGIFRLLTDDQQQSRPTGYYDHYSVHGCSVGPSPRDPVYPPGMPPRAASERLGFLPLRVV